MPGRMLRRSRMAAIAMALVVAAPVAGLAQHLMTDDFSDPTTGWTVRNDGGPVVMDYVDGQFQMSATGPIGLFIASQRFSFGDGTVSVEATDLPGSAAHYSGIFVRAQDSANFYAFVLGSDGAVGIFHYVSGTYFADATNLTLREGLYHTDAPNILSVTGSGSSLHFFANGEEVASIPFARWSEGVTGLIVVTRADGMAGTAFDNWRIELAQ